VRPALISIRNWFAMFRGVQKGKTLSDSRILSVAVDPDCQGLGIGSHIVELGLEYLRSKGVKLVQLEVRPDNQAAKHVYEKSGFQSRGETRDSQGAWLVMVKTFEADTEV
jgi:[ribosomal protein S18]-alanine N-acetyltransferase